MTITVIKLLSATMAVSLSLSLLVAREANAISYTFTKIADTSDQFKSFFYPAINDKGTVAFPARLDTGGAGIFAGNGGATATIADTSGPFSGFGGIPAINDEGTVVFQASLAGGGAGVFTSSGGATTTIANTSGPFSSFSDHPAINNEGTVAFQASLTQGGASIFTSSDGVISTIVDTSGPFRGLSDPALNNKGTVAFIASQEAGGGRRGIFTSSGGTLTTIATDTSGLFRFVGSEGIPAINDEGNVAFEAGPVEGYVGIFTGSGGEPTTIANTNAILSLDSLENPAINDRGTVAFQGSFTQVGGSIILTGPDLVTNKVIATGDTLFGSKVRNIFFSNNGLNNSGQFTFNADFTNNTSGIFRADPVTVPEPSSTISILGFGVLGAGCLLKHKQNKQKLINLG